MWFIIPNCLEYFGVVRRRCQSWPGQTPSVGILFCRKKMYLYVRFDLIRILSLQSTSRSKWPQDHLMKNKVKLSPDILWVDEMAMGSTTSRYFLRRWDENLPVSICGVYGNTTLTLYKMGRLEDDWGIPHPIWKCKLRFISSPIWKGKLRFISAPTWKGKFG